MFEQREFADMAIYMAYMHVHVGALRIRNQLQLQALGALGERATLSLGHPIQLIMTCFKIVSLPYFEGEEIVILFSAQRCVDRSVVAFCARILTTGWLPSRTMDIRNFFGKREKQG